MLSISAVSGGSAQSGYYRAEGYYLQDSKEASEASQYFGKAANEAGFKGLVNDDHFSALLDGESPAGRMMGRIGPDGERQHRPGLDLTFSAPKGVSIAGLVVGDERVIAAHTAAVKEAMTYVEDNLVQTRIKKNGVLSVQTGGKIIAGLFQHDTSRALDPQLHTHAVIANMVKADDGRFRALHNNKIYENTLLVGQIYRNALATNLENAGYTIERKDKGLFDVKEIPREMVQAASTRRLEIEASLKERNLEANTKNNDLAALATRASKKPIDRTELYATWKSEAEKSGIDLTALRPKQIDKDTVQKADPDASVRFAVSHISERESVYERDKVIDVAMKHGHRNKITDVEASLNRMVKNKDVYAVDVAGGPHLTDKQTIALERDNIVKIGVNHGNHGADIRTKSEKALHRSNDGAIERRLNRTDLTEGQQDAIKLGLSTKEGRFVGIQGVAGTGKTTALRTLNAMASKAGYEVHGTAPTLKAVEALSEAIPGSRTVDSALVLAQHRGPVSPDKKTILVVDEASMTSSAQMNQLLNLANEAKYNRVILVGDIKQLDAVGAGSTFRQLQENGLKTAVMADVVRQNTEEGRQAVLHAYAGEIANAFSKIEPVVQTQSGESRVENRGFIADAMSGEYLARSAPHRDRTGMVVMTNELRVMVNERVQGGLLSEGTISGFGTELTTLTPRGFTKAETREVASYERGNVVISTRPNADLNIESGVQYKVVETAQEKRSLTLSSPEGTTIEVPMGPDDKASSRFIVLQEAKQTFYAGDKVKFKITDNDHGIVNSATGTLAAISENNILVKNTEGVTTQLPRDSLAAKGMQLAYASTAHDFQGASIEQTLVGLNSWEQLATQKAFYVSISRMKEATQIYTEDPEKLVNTIYKQTGERINALDVIDRKQVEMDLKRDREWFPDQKSPALSSDQLNPKTAENIK
ncbi:MAG: MobF family relaxase, partial [Pseudoruegeria sp.]